MKRTLAAIHKLYWALGNNRDRLVQHLAYADLYGYTQARLGAIAQCHDAIELYADAILTWLDDA